MPPGAVGERPDMKLDDIERRLGEWVQQGMRKMADEILPRLQSVAMPFQREDDAEPGDACDATCYVARDDGIFPEEGTVGTKCSTPSARRRSRTFSSCPQRVRAANQQVPCMLRTAPIRTSSRLRCSGT